MNGMSFLTTISNNLYYRTAQWIPDRTPDTYSLRIKEVMQIYHAAGFTVSAIRCDNEFRPLLSRFCAEFTTLFNYSNPQEHVPEAERNNRVIKERIRATYHRLPFKQLTKTMIQELVSQSAAKLNYFPAKHGVSKYYSPRMILHQVNLDYDKHCRYAFGTYVQAHDEPGNTSTNASRSLDCIYLSHNSRNTQGGHRLLHLPTNRIVIRRNITPSPITQHIIDAIQEIADYEQVPKGLKVTNRFRPALYDAALSAGLDSRRGAGAGGHTRSQCE